MKRGKTLVTFRVDARIVERLRDVSRKTGITQTRLTENALRDYMSRVSFPPEYPLGGQKQQ